MYFVLTVALLILSLGECADINNGTRTVDRAVISDITVSNGQPWGDWGALVKCPTGTYATGFSLKVHSLQGFWYDDTALNGIRLYCTKPISPSSTTTTPGTIITSSVGSYGEWTQILRCTRGVLQAFQLRVESYQGLIDDSAATNIRFRCTGNQELLGYGATWGNWGSWSTACLGTGICGIKTLVDSYNLWDITSLCDVHFVCCD